LVFIYNLELYLFFDLVSRPSLPSSSFSRPFTRHASRPTLVSAKTISPSAHTLSYPPRPKHRDVPASPIPSTTVSLQTPMTSSVLVPRLHPFQHVQCHWVASTSAPTKFGQDRDMHYHHYCIPEMHMALSDNAIPVRNIAIYPADVPASRA
jgi:hypothetical protein